MFSPIGSHHALEPGAVDPYVEGRQKRRRAVDVVQSAHAPYFEQVAPFLGREGKANRALADHTLDGSTSNIMIATDTKVVF